MCAGLKLPHAPGLPQFAVQLTPRFAVSWAVVAASVVCAPVASDAGGGEGIVTTMGAAVTKLTVAWARAARFVVDVAVMVAVPEGAVEGATYEAALPLAVW